MAKKIAGEKCPSCGGSDIRTMRFQGETYFQCFSTVSERHASMRFASRPPEPGQKVTCKFWSTKWKPTEGGE